MSSDDETRAHDGVPEILRIDELCDRFEDEWRAGGGGPSVEEYLRALGLTPATAPPELVSGLARLEKEYRGRLAPGAERFPAGMVLSSRYRVEGLPIGVQVCLHLDRGW